MTIEALTEKMERWVDDFWERFVAMRKGIGTENAMVVLTDVFSLVMLSGGDRAVVDGKAAQGVLESEWKSAADAIIGTVDSWSRERIAMMRADPQYADAVKAVEDRRKKQARESN